MNKPIGVFDSGVGGLTVAAAVMKAMPGERIIYFGDTARVPYGNKSPETVTRFARQIIRFLLTKEVKAIIVACNTVSSVSMKALKSEFDIPLFGVVEPGVAEAVRTTRNKRVGIIGTSATIKSNAYKNLICAADKEIEVFSQACPLFVPLAEEGWTDNEITRLTAEEYLRPLVEKGIDTLVMGCTHYPLLADCIKDVAGEKIAIVDPAEATAFSVKRYLEKEGMLNAGGGRHVFYVSDMTDKLEFICRRALDESFPLEKMDIEAY